MCVGGCGDSSKTNQGGISAPFFGRPSAGRRLKLLCPPATPHSGTSFSRLHCRSFYSQRLADTLGNRSVREKRVKKRVKVQNKRTPLQFCSISAWAFCLSGRGLAFYIAGNGRKCPCLRRRRRPRREAATEEPPSLVLLLLRVRKLSREILSPVTTATISTPLTFPPPLPRDNLNVVQLSLSPWLVSFTTVTDMAKKSLPAASLPLPNECQWPLAPFIITTEEEEEEEEGRREAGRRGEREEGRERGKGVCMTVTSQGLQGAGQNTIKLHRQLHRQLHRHTYIALCIRSYIALCMEAS